MLALGMALNCFRKQRERRVISTFSKLLQVIEQDKIPNERATPPTRRVQPVASAPAPQPLGQGSLGSSLGNGSFNPSSF